MIDWLARLVPIFPLAACILTAVLGPKVLRGRSHWPTIAGCALSALCSLALVVCVADSSLLPQAERTVPLYTWASIGGPAGSDAGELDVTLALRLDSLSATMLAMVTFVATLIAIYSAGYMHGDRGYWRFFSVVSLFVFSMIMLVFSANFLQLYVFWEAVGLCSYLLIGFWYQRPAAAAAAMKAFLVNRIGDFGFAAGVFWIWVAFGSLDFSAVLTSEAVAAVPASAITGICLCLFMGAVGKSAQFPLHVWLPDAMEGPTPVSALIHAATMVTAGVYMVARATPLFEAAPQARLVVAAIGGFTALLAALIALTQTDLKRVLAYSTVSQLGFMFLGLGTGLVAGIWAAMFHLVTHAFFKALLFLGAGSVMHAMGGVIDMREFRGLRHRMPQTCLTFLVGSLALAGFPLLSGFWSKDAILSAVREAAHAGGPESELFGLPGHVIYGVLFYSAVATALLTAFYTFRAFSLTFLGPERIPPEAGDHAHESPPVMCIPLWILAAGAAGLGLVLDSHTTGLFGRFLGETIPQTGEAHHGVDWTVMGLSTLAALAGIGAALAMYAKESPLPARVAAAAGPLARLSRNRFYIDELYQLLFVLPLKGLALLSRLADWALIDGLLVGGLSRVPRILGRLPQPIQNGLVQFYALAMMLATAVLLWALLTKN